jgi:hypothetical protein
LSVSSALARYAPRVGQVLILDNRDSFTFNLAHRLFEVGVAVGVARSDALTLDDRGVFERRLDSSTADGVTIDVDVSSGRRLALTVDFVAGDLGCAVAGAFTAQGHPHGLCSAAAAKLVGLPRAPMRLRCRWKQTMCISTL